MCLHTYKCICEDIQIFICEYMSVYTHTHTNIYILIYLYTKALAYTCIYIYVFGRNVRTHVHTYVRRESQNVQNRIRVHTI